jgi:hypothetical protein
MTDELDLDELDDGCGCVELCEYLSERRESPEK